MFRFLSMSKCVKFRTPCCGSRAVGSKIASVDGQCNGDWSSDNQSGCSVDKIRVSTRCNLGFLGSICGRVNNRNGVDNKSRDIGQSSDVEEDSLFTYLRIICTKSRPGWGLAPTILQS